MNKILKHKSKFMKNLHLIPSVERKILQAMSGIDDAIFVLQEIEDHEEEIGKLLNCKKDLKKLLNTKFDALAQRRLKRQG